MNRTTSKISRTVWFIGDKRTSCSDGRTAETGPDAFSRGIGGILQYVIDRSVGAPEISVLISPAGARTVGLFGQHQLVTDSARRAGYQHGKPGPWTVFHANGRPTIHVGQISRIHARQVEDGSFFPFFSSQIAHTLSGMQRWHDLTGVAWQAGPPVMGVELMHRTLPRYRFTADAKRASAKPAKKDPEGTPHGAKESMWTTRAWRRPPREVARELGRTGGPFWLHGYDKVRAGFTAAGTARLSPTRLEQRRGGTYDRARAGWYLIPSPAWNDPRLPHPCGPDAQHHQARLWVTNATMDLISQLAEESRIAMPEIIESWTGPARALLEPWYATLMQAYQHTPTDRYGEADQAIVRTAVRSVGKTSLGMLANPDSTIYRPDWFHGINATKRANAWRKIDTIARTEGRYPAVVDDDNLYYPSLDADPVTAAPTAFRFTDPEFNPDAGYAYRIATSREILI